MCGRYGIVPDAQALITFFGIFGDAVRDSLLALPPQPEVRPTDPAPVILRDAAGVLQVQPLSWMLKPVWWKDPQPPRHTFNARVEEAATKPMWRGPLQTHRCLIPVSYWFEWPEIAGKKTKTQIRGNDDQVMAFAGLWSPVGSGSFSMMTTAAAPAIAHIHDRMPVALHPAVWQEWLRMDPMKTADACELAQTSALTLFST